MGGWMFTEPVAHDSTSLIKRENVIVSASFVLRKVKDPYSRVLCGLIVADRKERYCSLERREITFCFNNRAAKLLSGIRRKLWVTKDPEWSAGRWRSHGNLDLHLSA